MYDVCVLGKGPAGLSAGIYAVRAGAKTLVVGGAGGALALAKRIDNYFGFDSIGGQELLDRGEAQYSALGGQVSFLEEGVATVTVVDRGYAVGTQVAVAAQDGTLLGSGPLYVHKALHVTGHLGTVARVYRSEGSVVEAGYALIGLSDTADLAEYQALE